MFTNILMYVSSFQSLFASFLIYLKTTKKVPILRKQLSRRMSITEDGETISELYVL